MSVESLAVKLQTRFQDHGDIEQQEQLLTALNSRFHSLAGAVKDLERAQNCIHEVRESGGKVANAPAHFVKQAKKARTDLRRTTGLLPTTEKPLGLVNGKAMEDAVAAVKGLATQRAESLRKWLETEAADITGPIADVAIPEVPGHTGKV